jgi:hypothetical protein
MQKFKSFLKKLFFILTSLPIFLSFLFLGCRGKEIKPDDFSSGLANRDPKLEDGLLYIETGNIQEAA